MTNTTIRNAATALDRIADDMADEHAAVRTDGQVAEDYGYGRVRPDWTAALNAANTLGITSGGDL